jgi:intraflagellar transport protein 74
VYCREKFEELVQKERELNNFMDSFPSSKAEKLGEKQSREDAILNCLDKINKLQQITKSALPSQKKFKEMQVRSVVYSTSAELEY